MDLVSQRNLLTFQVNNQIANLILQKQDFKIHMNFLNECIWELSG